MKNTIFFGVEDEGIYYLEISNTSKERPETQHLFGIYPFEVSLNRFFSLVLLVVVKIKHNIVFNNSNTLVVNIVNNVAYQLKYNRLGFIKFIFSHQNPLTIISRNYKLKCSTSRRCPSTKDLNFHNFLWTTSICNSKNDKILYRTMQWENYNKLESRPSAFYNSQK